MSREITSRTIITLLLILIITLASYTVSAEENNREYAPTKYGMSLITGNTYDPTNNISFYMASGFILYDYDKVWKHDAPDQLRFKLEGNIGVAYDKKTRFISSVNMLALYYLDSFKSQGFKPYVEAGIGVIYTDFQVKGQGLRFNFNPQLGLGTEIRTKTDNTYFLALRLHHISNGGLDDENRGINSVMCMLGYYF